jgi:hypothetical protein
MRFNVSLSLFASFIVYRLAFRVFNQKICVNLWIKSNRSFNEYVPTLASTPSQPSALSLQISAFKK